MKRHRITVKLQIDLPATVSPKKVLTKLKTTSQSVTFGEYEVLSIEALPEELLPYEQYDNDKISIRNALLTVFKNVGMDWLCVKITCNQGQWSDTRYTKDAVRHMYMKIWAKSTDPHRHAGEMEFHIHDGEIWDKSNHVKLSPLADPKFEGLVRFINEFYNPKPKPQPKPDWGLDPAHSGGHKPYDYFGDQGDISKPCAWDKSWLIKDEEEDES